MGTRESQRRDRRPLVKKARLSRTFRAECVHRVTPVDPVEHVGELCRRDRDAAARRRRPDEAAALQPLGIEREPETVVPEDLDQVAALARETRKDRRRTDRARASPAPAATARSCRAACRCARPQATRAHLTAPGSSPPQHDRGRASAPGRRNANRPEHGIPPATRSRSCPRRSRRAAPAEQPRPLRLRGDRHRHERRRR